MAEYKKRTSSSSFGARAGRPSFGKQNWSDRRSKSGPVERFKAICTRCGTACEVPFKPVNGKPVLCRDCYAAAGDAGGARSGDRYQKREYQPRGRAGAAPTAPSDRAVLKQLEMLNEKIERLIRAVEGSASGQ